MPRASAVIILQSCSLFGNELVTVWLMQCTSSSDRYVEWSADLRMA